jgi:hypothetical protein
MISLALLIASLVLFILAAAGIPGGRVNLTSAGLACFVASMLVGRM